MSASTSLRALRRANPRANPGFAETVDTTAAVVRVRLAMVAVP